MDLSIGKWGKKVIKRLKKGGQWGYRKGAESVGKFFSCAQRKELLNEKQR